MSETEIMVSEKEKDKTIDGKAANTKRWSHRCWAHAKKSAKKYRNGTYVYIPRALAQSGPSCRSRAESAPPSILNQSR